MILVFGLGLTGVSVCKFLESKHLEFAIADTRSIPPNAELFSHKQTYYKIINTKILNDITSIIVSPGIKLTHPLIIEAKKREIQILSDIDLFYLYHPNKTYIGITGTNGKSTTTKLLEHILVNNGVNAISCGNIGTPILDTRDNYDVYIIEFSSYQIDISQYILLDYATVLNISEDHLDRYTSFQAYVNSKLRIYVLCKTPIINPFNLYTTKISGISYDTNYELNFPALIGEHNTSNAHAAITITKQLGVSIDVIAQALQSYTGLPHRLEYVGNVKNIDCFNDSKATNTNATLAALKALTSRYKNIAIIIGGEMKEENYAGLYCVINTLSHAILIGESTKIFSSNITINTHIAKNMKTAVNIGLSLQVDALLLSPACTSFDMYNNFALRGEDFKQCLQEHN